MVSARNAVGTLSTSRTSHGATEAMTSVPTRPIALVSARDVHTREGTSSSRCLASRSATIRVSAPPIPRSNRLK